MDKLTGLYNLVVEVGDGLPDKQLCIFDDGKVVLLEFKGGIQGAYQYFYLGKLESTVFHFHKKLEYSNYLVDDALESESRIFETLLDEKVLLAVSNNIFFERNGFRCQFEIISTTPGSGYNWLLPYFTENV